MVRCYQNKWTSCLASSLLFFYLSIMMNIYNPMSIEVIKQLNINGQQYGYLSASYLLANVLFLIPAGIISEISSQRKILLFATLASSVLTFGFSLIDNLYEGIIINFLLGILGSFCFVVPAKLIKLWFPTNYISSVFGIILSLAMLGGVIANFLFTWLSYYMSWRTNLQFMGILAIIFLIIKWGFVYAPSYHKNDIISLLSIKTTLKKIVYNKKNTLKIFLAGIYNSLMNLSLPVLGAEWGIVYLISVFHLKKIGASIVVSMLFIGMSFGSLIFGTLADRYIRKSILMFFAGLFSLVAFILLQLGFMSKFYELLIVFLLIGTFCGSQALGYSLVIGLSPSQIVSINTSIISVIVMLGGTVMQPLFGFVLDNYSKTEQGQLSTSFFTALGFSHALKVFYVSYLACVFISLYFYFKQNDILETINV